ncbi:MAG TPA: selenide, water dikinase SelD [Pyrinomonadaceae bacterium]|nr:selenide, water dikinase SelD [Pyrinomonadaceae bacterium]
MAKLSPSDLAQVLGKLPKQDFENVIVGFETADDAAVVRLGEGETAIVQTVDFFTPVFDEPRVYGRAAAVNALNDVYAMGGRPLSALSIVCYPQKGDLELLGEILLGGQEAMNADAVPVVGGHSVDDAEIKIGYAVTGLINANGVIKNAGARPGDVLVLTKPLGTGAITTAIKNEKAEEDSVSELRKVLTHSALAASKAMVETGVSACTDITGFGLLGHAFEMAKASGVTLRIRQEDVPFMKKALEYIEAGMLTRGDKNNRNYVGDNVFFDKGISAVMQSALFDPQTAGGLLISVPEERCGLLLEKIRKEEAKLGREGFEPAVIGSVEEKSDTMIIVE